MKNKVMAGVLNCGRYDLLRRTLLSVKFLKDLDVKFALMDNGSPQEDIEKIKREFEGFFDLNIFSKENLGIGGGINNLHAAARSLGFEYFLMLENDWECLRYDNEWIKASVEILDNNSNIGIVKLRIENDGQYDMREGNYPHVSLRYSPWWVKPLPLFINTSKTSNNEEFHYGFVESGYSNNPHLLRLEMFEDIKMDDSVKGKGKEEEKFEILPKKLGYMTANLSRGVFKHIG